MQEPTLSFVRQHDVNVIARPDVARRAFDHAAPTLFATHVTDRCPARHTQTVKPPSADIDRDTSGAYEAVDATRRSINRSKRRRRERPTASNEVALRVYGTSGNWNGKADRRAAAADMQCAKAASPPARPS
jgi:hypothetical protein